MKAFARAVVLALIGLGAVGAEARPYVQEERPTVTRSVPELRPMRRADPDADVGPFSAGRAGLRLSVDGAPVPYRVIAVPVLPEQRIALTAEPGFRTPVAPGDSAILESAAGRARVTGGGRWEWRAPERPGPTALRVRLGAEEVTVNIFVMHPRSALEDGRLLGYRIGSYVAPRPGNRTPPRPRGWVMAHRRDEDILLSPHFTAGQFQVKDPGNPKAFLFTRDLLVKLETFLETLNARGIQTPSLHVMSGFRTPAYNRAIGNTTTQSRHLYGDAADIFVDVDRDGRMDDLNGDGRSDRSDVEILAGIMQSLETQGRVVPGGLSVYPRAPHRGPFLHLDARGWPARW